jgi:cytochrome c553
MSPRRVFAMLLAAAAVGSTVAATAAHAGMIDTSGLATWELCAICHSADGISRMAKFPKLAGQRRDYITKQLRDFRAERRSNDGGPMLTNAGNLSDAQIAEVATYFSALPPPPPASGTLDPRVAATGARLFDEGKPDAGVPACAGCHAGAGKAGVLAPRIRAQHAEYLRKQLADFKSGARANDPDGLMRGVVAALSDSEIAAVSAYVATLERPEGKAP